MASVTSNVMWNPSSPTTNGNDDSQPWFFTPSYVTKNVIDFSRTDSETLCAEILSSLSEIIVQSDSDSDHSDEGSPHSPKYSPYGYRDFNGVSKKPFKLSKSKKEKMMKTIRFKRNVNACTEHRRKHQKCPMDCPRRRENTSYMDSAF